MHNDDDEVIRVALTYGEVRDFDERIRAIETGIARLLSRDTEVIELREKIAALEEGIARAVDKSDATEARARAGLPGAQ